MARMFTPLTEDELEAIKAWGVAQMLDDPDAFHDEAGADMRAFKIICEKLEHIKDL